MISILLICAAAQGGLLSEPEPLPGAQDEKKVWTGNIDGSLTIISGNNDSTTGSLNAKIGRTWGAWAVDAFAGFTGVRTTDPGTGVSTSTSRIITFGGGGKRFLDDTNNWYVYVKAADRRDEPNGLIERVDVGGGSGYKFDLYQDAWFGVELGAAWVSEELVGVANKEETGAVRVAYDFEAPFADHFKAYGNGEYINGGDVEAFVSLTGLKYGLTDRMSLFAALTLLYDGSPAPGFDDTDTIFLLGLSFTL